MLNLCKLRLRDYKRLSVVEHALSSITVEAEAGGSGVLACLDHTAICYAQSKPHKKRKIKERQHLSVNYNIHKYLLEGG